MVSAAIFMVVLLGVLLLAGIPVFLSLGVPAIAAMLIIGQPLESVAQSFEENVNSYALTAIPFFILMAGILREGGALERLVSLLASFVGHWRGGMGVVVVLASALFATMSGSSPANAAALGGILGVNMVKRGYPKAYTAGLIAAGGTLGILIPPSINMILYSSVTNLPAVDLFQAGIIPGIVLTAILGVTAVMIARRGRYPVEPRVDWSERIQLVRRHGAVLLLPVIVYAAIFTGVVTVTESAVAGVVGALLIEVVIYREITWRQILGACRDTLQTTSMILLIIAASSVFSYVLTFAQVPQDITSAAGGLVSVSGALFILVVSVFLIVLGDFLDVAAITYLVIPILYPILAANGFDQIQFAILFILNMELALITPPIGLNTFILSNTIGISISRVLRGALPYLGGIVLTMVLVGAVPALTSG